MLCQNGLHDMSLKIQRPVGLLDCTLQSPATFKDPRKKGFGFWVTQLVFSAVNPQLGKPIPFFSSRTSSFLRFNEFSNSILPAILTAPISTISLTLEHMVVAMLVFVGE